MGFRVEGFGLRRVQGGYQGFRGSLEKKDSSGLLGTPWAWDVRCWASSARKSRVMHPKTQTWWNVPPLILTVLKRDS